MNDSGRFAGTRRYLQIHWPAYVFGYGGGFLFSLAVIFVSFIQEWWAFIPPALAIMLILCYFLLASLWASYQQFDVREHQDHHLLFELGDLQPTDHFAHISLGSLQTAFGLSRRLTSGHITVVDIYNPQISPGSTLARSRKLSRHPPLDPRISWGDGSFDLLPLPDNSVKAVTISRSLGAFWQHGDRICLLQEVKRVLRPGGRLLLAERARSETNALVLGPAVLRLPALKQWRELLQVAGFQIISERSVKGLAFYWLAEKPRPGAEKQLAFDFGF